MKPLTRTLLNTVGQDIKRKIVLLSGPRQTGKTTLAKMVSPGLVYLSYDDEGHRKVLREKSWDRTAPLIVFDELHKMPKWKSWLKGVYDVEGIPPALLVTGSARLETFRKTGDSLAGRFFHHRVHPFDIRELSLAMPGTSPKELQDRLMLTGGFPEPFLGGSETEAARWRKSHLDIILRQDLLDLHGVRQLKSVEVMVSLLASRVGSTISHASLARDLAVSPKTVKSWLDMLEDLYVVFRITPYAKNVSRSLVKEGKYYFFDLGRVEGEAARWENLVALALKKECDRLEDQQGASPSLHFLKTRDGKEIDFLVTGKGIKQMLVEVKTQDDQPSSSWGSFREIFPNATFRQWTLREIPARGTQWGLRVCGGADEMAVLDLAPS